MDNLAFPPDEGEPFEPSAEDLAEMAAWNAANDPGDGHGPFCPADLGHYCENCDREMAEAWAARRDAEAASDGWYLDLCMRADHPGDHYRGDC